MAAVLPLGAAAMSAPLAPYWLAPAGDTRGPAVEVASMTTVLSSPPSASAAAAISVAAGDAPRAGSAARKAAKPSLALCLRMRIILIRIIDAGTSEGQRDQKRRDGAF